MITNTLFFKEKYMQKRTYYFSLITIAMALAILACNMPGTTTIPQNTPDYSSTAVAQTVQAELARANLPQVTLTPPAANTASPSPTLTNPPPTETQQPTLTSLPCNQASFVQDVSIPDGTVIEISKAFTKTWRLKNTGSCTWTSGYQLVFVNGDQMSGSGAQSLTSGTVAPNSTVDVSVNLVAPSGAGTYRGYWKIREPGGATFGVSTGAFWVEIKAENPSVVVEPPPIEVQMPDLAVSGFTISPSTPIQGNTTHVSVAIVNHGNKLTSQFIVAWYGLSTFTNPSCSWTVMDIIPPSGSITLQCNYVFASWYPLNKTSLVIVDTTNHVHESNEDNNQATISPFGVNKP
jgi:hypothetical protein